jgi:hypothetical protein
MLCKNVFKMFEIILIEAPAGSVELEPVTVIDSAKLTFKCIRSRVLSKN